VSLRAARWSQLWSALGARGNADPVLASLEAQWSTPGRWYHALPHLDRVLEHFDRMQSEADDPVTAELALWMHDVVWDAMAADAEARSAAWMRQQLEPAGVSNDRLARAARLILATRHLPEPPGSADEAVVRDADLAILAAPDDEFDAYDAAIHLEYDAVPDDEFRAGRTRVLRAFLTRPAIFFTNTMKPLEGAARRNVGRALERLDIGF
jgi:predicted metal-dependent HD superfamily phosphohydrolase